MMTNYSNLHRLLSTYQLILASGSPRRVRILNDAGIKFRQIIPNVDETIEDGLEPTAIATELAERKAAAVLELLENNQIAMGCDTIVVIDDEILGKPENKEEALEMLTKLSGHCHTVYTAVSLLPKNGRPVTGFEQTRVYFNSNNQVKLQEYIDSGEPMDKAGAYGIQGAGGFLVDRIEGNLDNVVGLPMSLLNELAGRILRNRESDGKLSH